MSLSDDLKKCANIASSLEQQLSTLTADHDKLTQDHQALAERLRESEAGAAAMRKVIERLEWSGRTSETGPYCDSCPFCDEAKEGGKHGRFCDLAAALGGTAGRDLLAEMDAAKERAAEAEQRHADADDHIDALNETIETQRARIAELEAKLKAAEPSGVFIPQILPVKCSHCGGTSFIGTCASGRKPELRCIGCGKLLPPVVADQRSMVAVNALYECTAHVNPPQPDPATVAASMAGQPPQPSVPVGVKELMEAVKEELATVRRLAEQLVGQGKLESEARDE